jgi:hypothetical protein
MNERQKKIMKDAQRLHHELWATIEGEDADAALNGLAMCIANIIKLEESQEVRTVLFVNISNNIYRFGGITDDS